MAERVAKVASERRVAPEQVAAELVTNGVLTASRRRPRFGFVGMGDSGAGDGDIGRQHREVIRESTAHTSARDV